jgi:RNA polymerase sigma-70 factor (ECF subfamily)
VLPVDQARVRSWYEEYKQEIFRYCFYLTRDVHLSEDILHDTFLKLLSGRFRDVGDGVKPWLYKVARNLCYDQLRRSKHESPEPLEVAPSQDSYTYIELLSVLQEKDREIVTLKIIGNLTHKEIGSVLGISTAAAQKRYERAIATLREQEDRYGTKTI